jgi:hypothetical protein
LPRPEAPSLFHAAQAGGPRIQISVEKDGRYLEMLAAGSAPGWPEPRQISSSSPVPQGRAAQGERRVEGGPPHDRTRRQRPARQETSASSSRPAEITLGTAAPLTAVDNRDVTRQARAVGHVPPPMLLPLHPIRPGEVHRDNLHLDGT